MSTFPEASIIRWISKESKTRNSDDKKLYSTTHIKIHNRPCDIAEEKEIIQN